MLSKIKTSMVVLAIALITVPSAWAAFPVNTTKTVKTQSAAVSQKLTDTETGISSEVKSNEKKSAKVAKKEIKQSFWKKLRNGGKSQLIALLLVILVGALGIHRFYLGYTWQGIVQLLTLGGCGIWALIDLIRIATGNLEPKDGPYDETL